jgi:hypothetical protein
MDGDKDLLLEDGSKIKWFPKAHTYFLNKTTILYGRTGTGKTTIIDEIMYLCKDYIAIPFVITKSNVAKSGFDGKIPQSCIKSEMTKEWLETFLATQKGRATLYNTANQMETLKSLFDKAKTPADENIEKTINMYAAKYTHSIENNERMDYDKKKQQLDMLAELQLEKLVNLYKTVIRRSKLFLEKRANNLTPEELCCLNYLDFKPNILLIFDDCASEFKKWVKESTAIKEMFYMGRHYYITTIITAQDDTEIYTELRKNAIVNIFTSQQSAIANFTRSSNSFPKHEKIRADICVRKIFKQDITVKNHKKLVYLQNTDDDPFYYIIADMHNNFKIGCPSLWELDRKVNTGKSRIADDDINKFFARYHKL